MARAMLRDDYSGAYPEGGRGMRLDDDSLTSVKAGLGYDPVVPGVPVPSPGGSVNPTVTVRERISEGYDDDGNALWSWVAVVADAEAISWEQREEKSDTAAMAVVVGKFTILYPADYPDVRETAVVESGGHSWSVTGVERLPDRILLSVRRIDDGQ